MDVNGRHMSEFLTNDFMAILKQVFDKNDLHNLNERIRKACHEYLDIACTGDVKQVCDENTWVCGICKKNCLTRSVKCDKCKFWVHYKCEKLQPDFIDVLEKDKSMLYTCSKCDKTHSVSMCSCLALPTSVTHTNSKPVDSSNLHRTSNVVLNTSSALTPASSVVSNSIARNILNEEASDRCSVCASDISSDISEVCELCDSLCHNSCTKELYTNNHIVKICIPCAASEDQRSTTDVTVQQSDSNCPNQQNSAAVSVQQSTASIRTDTTRDTAHGIVALPAESQPHNTTDTVADAPAPAKQQPCRKETSNDRHESTSTSSANVATKKTTSRQTSSSANSEEASVKMKDVRTKEQRLRKWEEELKLRETQLKQQDERAHKKDTYIAQLEAKNIELEQTVRILRRRVAMLEESPIEDTQKAVNSQPKPTDKLLGEIHDRVTRFIVDKVDKQLQQLSDENSTSADSHSDVHQQHTQQQHSAPSSTGHISEPKAHVSYVDTRPRHGIFVPHSQRPVVQQPPHYTPRNSAYVPVLHRPGTQQFVQRPVKQHVGANQPYMQYMGSPVFYGATNPIVTPHTNVRCTQHHFLDQRPHLNLRR